MLVRLVSPPICPECGFDDEVVPIAHGVPDRNLIHQSQRGEVALAGCCVAGGASAWYCKACQRKFDIPKRDESSG